MSTPRLPTARRLVGVGGAIAPVLLIAGFAFLAEPARAAAAAEPEADLAVSQTANFTQAPVGTIVSFVSLAWNNGPDDAANSVFDSFSRPVGLVVRHETCIGPPRVSADGQFCEYSGVPIGQKVKTVIRTKLTGAPGSYASLRVCASSGVATTDPVSSNNCRTTKVLITAE